MLQIRKMFIIIVAVSLIISSLTVPTHSSEYFDDFTHALFDEHFSATWCPACRSEEPDVLDTYNDLSGSFFIVTYHIADALSSDEGNAKIAEYQAHTLPYHVFDGAYWYGKGRISTTNMEDPATRPVHRIGLAVAKSIQGNILEYIGSVKEMEKRDFTGYVQIYVTENEVMSQGIEWNFVFRGFGLGQELNMKPGEVVQFSGEWTIPSNVEAGNLLVVATVFDDSTVGVYGSYAVQSVDDSKSGQVIPEISTPLRVAVLGFIACLLVVFIKRRSKLSSN